jgi:hypothetical protein
MLVEDIKDIFANLASPSMEDTIREDAHFDGLGRQLPFCLPPPRLSSVGPAGMASMVSVNSECRWSFGEGV